MDTGGSLLAFQNGMIGTLRLEVKMPCFLQWGLPEGMAIIAQIRMFESEIRPAFE